MHDDSFVPVVGILVLFGLPITYAIVSRVLAHQERLEMLKRGIVPPLDPKWARRWAKHGWYAPPYGQQPGAQQPGPGTQPGNFQMPQNGCDPYTQYSADRYLRKGITVAMIGMALLIGLSFISLGTPGPWLLGGLIPLFVGIAQIIIALLSGARFGAYTMVSGPPPGPSAGQNPGSQYQQPQPQPPPFTAKRDVSGPYAWRPGPTAELEPPPNPPDVQK